MRGRTPKAPGFRRRRNRTSTAATLSATGGRRRAPSLPRGRQWQALTVAWWHDVWHSPMAAEFLRADLHGLYRLAVLVDRFWSDPAVSLAAEIRQQQAAYGLTPIDRRRLQWEVEKVESAAQRRRPAPPPTGDPRELLRRVK